MVIVIVTDGFNFVLFFQNKLVQLLEIALVDGVDKVSDTLQPCSINSLVDLLPKVADCCGIDLENHVKCSLQGISDIVNSMISCSCFISLFTL